MAEPTTEAAPPPPTPLEERQPLSRPVFRQRLVINSLQAQRIMARSFGRVANALFSMDVILRIIGNQQDINRIETLIKDHFEKLSTDMSDEIRRLETLKQEQGIDSLPEYSVPEEYSIEITSPEIAHFTHLIRNLDKLMGIIDTLWLNSVLSSQQRSDATYEWQQRLMKLAGRIIGIEKRARHSAHAHGKHQDAAQQPDEKPVLTADQSDHSNSPLPKAVAAT